MLFLPRSENLSDDASAGLARYAAGLSEDQRVTGMVYPDRRGAGFALSRFNDHLGFDFTRVGDEPDVHFAHARGFVAKVTATDPARITEVSGTVLRAILTAGNHPPGHIVRPEVLDSIKDLNMFID